MKQTLPFVILLISVLLTACAPRGDGHSQASLLASLETFNQAFQEGKVETLEAMITEDYVHSNGSSKAIGKEAWLNYLRKRKGEIDAGALKVSNYEMEELEVAMHGTTAIVAGKIMVRNERKEEVFENAYRVTHIWVFENGSWKRAGFHDGKIE